MTDTPEYEKSELDLLKERANDMGITYSPNIKLETLRERVNAKLTSTTKATTAGGSNSFQDVYDSAMKLIRVRVTNLNPAKREARAEYFSAGNRVVPTITRLVPFEQDTHVEQILINHMKTRQYVWVRSERVDGKEVTENGMRPEFQIEVLPPLTKEELEALVVEQSKRQTV